MNNTTVRFRHGERPGHDQQYRQPHRDSSADSDQGVGRPVIRCTGHIAYVHLTNVNGGTTFVNVGLNDSLPSGWQWLLPME